MTQRIFKSAKDRIKKSIERERAFERHVEAFSRFLWPWRESFLIAVVSLLAALDYVSTYAALRLSGNRSIYESGLLARWSLETGGFTKLFLTDMTAIGILLLAALTFRFLFRKFGFHGFGRTSFVVTLTPYVVMTMAAIFNNVVLSLL